MNCAAAAALEAAQAIAAGAGLAFAPGVVLRSRRTQVAYELQAQLGSGAFGEVWRCAELAEGSASSGEAQPQRAVKIVKTQDLGAVVEEVRRHKRAVELAGKVHVPEFFDAAEADVLGRPSSSAFIIVMQLIEGLAADRLPRPEGLSSRERVASVVLHDVLVALRRLHAHGVVHRDVKPANILVNHAGECYLCDFGVSLFLDEVLPGQEMGQAGTPLYMAPEMLKTIPTRYDQKVDVWSLGVMGFQLELGRTPLQRSGDDMPTQGLIISTLQTMVSPVFESSFSLQYRNLVQRCLEVDPAQRPSSQELVQEQKPSASASARRLLSKLLGP